MLMFVFGAGASFDSDPRRRSGPNDTDVDYQHRPPLAAGLFEPRNEIAAEAAAAFPRATPLMMRLREATHRGLDVEQVLEQLQAAESEYPATASQLLALRAYLSDMLTRSPGRWSQQCQGHTNYVLALDEAARWRAAVYDDPVDPISCVTFNYDTLLEDACYRVFGRRISTIHHYATGSDVHVFKPHGSVDWRQAARWHNGPNHWKPGLEALHLAIDQAASLQWQSQFSVQREDRYQDASDATLVWLPALAIPVQRKAQFIVPSDHVDGLKEDLAKASTLIAVGWRARERHFLQMLQDHMPSAPARLVAVAEKSESAMETVDNLWETGRFDRYTTAQLGFSNFVETPDAWPSHGADSSEVRSLRLREVLAGGGEWKERSPGAGLPDTDEAQPLIDLTYVEV